MKKKKICKRFAHKSKFMKLKLNVNFFIKSLKNYKTRSWKL